jgi:hypothetical protein
MGPGGPEPDGDAGERGRRQRGAGLENGLQRTFRFNDPMGWECFGDGRNRRGFRLGIAIPGLRKGRRKAG